VNGAFPAAQRILLICWSVAVPLRECCEYLLFRQISTQFSVTIGDGRGPTHTNIRLKAEPIVVASTVWVWQRIARSR
jgi:hypothetical protein